MHDLDKDHLIHQIGEIEQQIKNSESWNADLSKQKTELVLKLSELEVELNRICKENGIELKKRLAELDGMRSLQRERREAQKKEESLLAIDIASTHEGRSGVDRLRIMVEEKEKQAEENIINHASELKSLEANTFVLRMQLTEASRQKFRDVNNGLEAHTTAEMVETCKAATIRNKTLEEELLQHSDEVMEMMTLYDATEIKLVKMKRQRDFKRNALELVQQRIASFSDKAMEYGTIVDETATQIMELKGGIERAALVKAESTQELKKTLIVTKAEAFRTAKLINERYLRLASDPLLSRNGLLNSSEGNPEDKDEDVIYSHLVDSDQKSDDIWNSSCTNMKDVCWS